MRRCFFALAALLVVLLPTSGRATPADECGLPSTGPLWIDYAGHDAPVVPKPGLILAVSSGTVVPTAMRAAGAATVFFDLHLNDRVGTDSKPADPTTMVDRANRLFDFAVEVSGCAQPVIAENELFGAPTTTPWSKTNAQYRANVLAYLQQLSARGAKPFLTIAGAPYVGGDAAEWWRQTAQAAVLVRQVFFDARVLHRLGPIAANRMIRDRMRQVISKLTSIGIPPGRIGLELVFVTAPGQGGREGLQPSAAWFEVIKWQTLSAKQVLREVPGLSSVFSWGWATFSQAGSDPDKGAAYCVYLWARSSTSCDGPGAAGPEFNASLTDGQLSSLPAAVRCRFEDTDLDRSSVYTLARVTHEREVAATALLEQIVQRRAARLPAAAIRRAERAIVAERFHGSRTAYVRALARAGATPTVARAVIASQLRRQAIGERLRRTPPTAHQVARFYDEYGGLDARVVEATPSPSWLGGRSLGVAIAQFAPSEVFAARAGTTLTVTTPVGPVAVRTLGPAAKLGAFPLDDARPSIFAGLKRYAERAAYETWLVQRERGALSKMLCQRDRPPALGPVDLTLYLPFLALD